METTVMDIGSVRHRLDGSVLVDRAWARKLGAGQAKGARRVGSFYRLPRAEYVRLVDASRNGSPVNNHPDLQWTRTDDLAVANMIEEAVRQDSLEQDSECVGCS